MAEAKEHTHPARGNPDGNPHGDPHGNFWLHCCIHGYDLTHPPTPTSAPIQPRLPLQTTTERITIDPAKSALLIIDMQNDFLSPALRGATTGKGLAACDKLVRAAIPAARKAGIRVVWLNWSLTDDDSFWVSSVVRLRGEPGSVLGPIRVNDETVVEGGTVMVRGSWNAGLYAPLEEARQQGVRGVYPRDDVLIHKDRLSGLRDAETDCSRFLKQQGIRTLLFAGVFTDQCVVGNLKDAFTSGYDCLLLRNGCATSGPGVGQEYVEYKTAKTWGFVLSCEDLAKGVEEMVRAAPKRAIKKEDIKW